MGHAGFRENSWVILKGVAKKTEALLGTRMAGLSRGSPCPREGLTYVKAQAVCVKIGILRFWEP